MGNNTEDIIKSSDVTICTLNPVVWGSYIDRINNPQQHSSADVAECSESFFNEKSRLQIISNKTINPVTVIIFLVNSKEMPQHAVPRINMDK